jgi:general secretion pathway protein D
MTFGKLSSARWGAAALTALILALAPVWAQEATVPPTPVAPLAPATATPSTAEGTYLVGVMTTLPTPAPTDTQPAVPLATPTSAPTTEPTTEPTTTGPTTSSAPTTTARSATSRPTTTRLAGPDTPISLNFKDAALRSVLEYLSEAAGLVVVEVAHVEGRVTVMSRQNISVDEGVALLDTVLKDKGYAAIRNGRTLKIVTLDQAKKELIPVLSGNDPLKMQSSDRMVTQIIPIRFADAIKLKTDLAALVPSGTDVASNASSNTLIITGTESSIRRIAEIIKAIDVHMSEVSVVKVFQLKYANATSAARLITDVFKEDQTGQPGAAPNAGGRRFAGGGAGGLGGFGGGFGGFGGPGGGAAAAAPGAAATDETGQRGVKVLASADDRTNTLVVSAAPDVMKVIEGVVKDLDSNPTEQAVFTYRVKNGRADNMATVLNNIFGSTGGTTAAPAANRVVGSSGSVFGNSISSTGNRNGSGARGTGLGTGGGSSGTAALGGGGGNRGGTTGGTTANRGGAGAAFTGAGGRGGTGTGAGMMADLTGQVYVVSDVDTNSLLVTTSSKNFDRVKAIIMELDRSVPQVLIKVLIAEVTHDNSLDLGLEFSGMNLFNSALAVSPTNNGFAAGTNFNVAAQTNGFTFKLDEKYATAAIHAIAQVSKLDVLSRPYILTGDNQEAQIMVGEDFPFITSSQITTDGQVINTIQYRSVGIILDVTPHINPEGLVTMDVYPEVSTPTGQTVPLNQFAASPVFATRYAQSRVAIRDGQTIVIGGLMRDQITKTVDKVPFLGDIPGLGLLFQHNVDQKSKTELLIFITPHVAQQPGQLKAMTEDELRGTKAVGHAVEEGAFKEHMQGMQRGASTQPAGADEDMTPSDIKSTSWSGKEDSNGGKP